RDRFPKKRSRFGGNIVSKSFRLSNTSPVLISHLASNPSRINRLPSPRFSGPTKPDKVGPTLAGGVAVSPLNSVMPRLLRLSDLASNHRRINRSRPRGTKKNGKRSGNKPRLHVVLILSFAALRPPWFNFLHNFFGGSQCRLQFDTTHRT